MNRTRNRRAVKSITRWPGGAILLLDGQFLHHVEQRLLVHVFVLQDHVEHASALRHDIFGKAARYRIKGFQNRAAHSVAILLRLFQDRPLLGNLRVPMTLTGIHIRINASAKKLVEMWIKRWPFQDTAANLIPRKRRQVTHVEKKRMPPNYRLGQ